MKSFNNHGDTLVEVLVATVIIGFVLMGGFVAVNHNTTVELQSQERNIALQLNQTQVERLRTLVGDGTISLTNLPTTIQLCVDESGNVIKEADKCYFNSQGDWSSIPITSGISYQVTISAVKDAQYPDGTWTQIKVNDSWLESGSAAGNLSTAILDYRFYPTVAAATTCPVGETGTPPNCVIPPTCPTGETGTPPNCVIPPTGICASYGYTHLAINDRFLNDGPSFNTSIWSLWDATAPHKI